MTKRPAASASDQRPYHHGDLRSALLEHAAKILRTSERRVEKRVGRGMKKLAKRLGKRRAPVDHDALASACATEGCAATVPEGLFLDILQAMEASRGSSSVKRTPGNRV